MTDWKSLLKTFLGTLVGVGLPLALVPLCLKDYDPLWLIGWLLMWANLCGWMEGYFTRRTTPAAAVVAYTPELLETLQANTNMTATTEDRLIPSTNSADMYSVFTRLHDQPISFPETL